MRAIGELCRDVIARLESDLATRGSFEPREFAVVFDGGSSESVARLNDLWEAPEVDSAAIYLDGRLELAAGFADPLPPLTGSATVAPVLALVRETEIGKPVVGLRAVDVINEQMRILAGVQKPGDAVSDIRLAFKRQQHVSEVVEAPRSAPGNMAVVIDLVRYRASLRVVGEHFGKAGGER